MHRLLRRQLRRVGIEGPDQAPTLEQWRALVERIERTYELADRDRYTLERSLELSSREMQALYDDLRRSAASELATERDKLESANAVLNATLEAGIDGILVVDGDREVVGYNHRFVDMWGLRDDQVDAGVDDALVDLVLPLLANPEVFTARIEELYDNPHATSRDELALLDGRVIDRFSAPVLAEGRVLGRVWFFRDITSSRRMELELKQANDDLEQRVAERTRALEDANAQLRRQVAEQRRVEQVLRSTEAKLRLSQKMDVVGQLAGGISHDFNNMLAVILTSAGMLTDLVDDDDAVEEVEQILQAGQRAAELTRQLLAFSRQQVLDPECVELAKIIRNVERMLGRLVGPDVRLVVDAPARGYAALVDPGQMELALVNLIVNARDAMPDGGRVSVVLRHTRPDEIADLTELGRRTHLAVDVVDEGLGMDEATLSRIFEPFFTTKAPGRGTGLGLAMVYGIVRQSGGAVSVKSTLGQGTRFTLYLPAATGAPRRTDRPAPRVGGKLVGTVLLVDDEHLVRAAARRALTRTGLRVIEASSGAEALRRLAEAPGPVHAMLTDIIMPAMNGIELAREVRATAPDLPIVFLSGHADDAALTASRDLGLLLAKPFTPDELLTAVRSALNSSAVAADPDHAIT